MGWGKPKSSEGRGGDVLSLKDGESKLLHIMFAPPEETRTIYHSVLKEAITLPPSHPDVEGVRYRYGFVVYDYAEKILRPWFVSKTTQEQLKEYYDAYGGTFDSLDVQVSRKGSGFNDTKYTVIVFPTKFSQDLAKDLSVPNMTELCKPSDPEKIKTILGTPDPIAEARREERLAQPSKPAQRKYLEDLVDKKKVSKSDFKKMLEVVDADPPKNGAFLPEALNRGQASRLIDMVKEF